MFCSTLYSILSYVFIFKELLMISLVTDELPRFFSAHRVYPCFIKKICEGGSTVICILDPIPI